MAVTEGIMSTISHSLHREIEAAKTLLANLADVIGDDAEFAADAVEGETSLNEAIDRAVQQMVNDRIAMTGLDLIISELVNRRARIDHRMGNMRTMLGVAMEQAGRKKIEHPAVTLSVRAVPPAVAITNEALIPSTYWKPSEPRLDKRAVLAALKAKESVPGAELSNGGQTIAMKWG